MKLAAGYGKRGGIAISPSKKKQSIQDRVFFTECEYPFVLAERDEYFGWYGLLCKQREERKVVDEELVCSTRDRLEMLDRIARAHERQIEDLYMEMEG